MIPRKHVGDIFQRMSFGSIDAAPCYHGISVITQSQLTSALEVQSDTTLNVFLALIPLGLDLHLISGVTKRSQPRSQIM